MITITEVDKKFFIDLTSKKIQFTEENNWFTDQLVSAYTLPEELPYSVHPFFLKYKSDHTDEYQIRFDVIVNLNGELFSARFELVDLNAHTFAFSIFYGQENFPNWDKKLSELTLEKLTVTNLRQHATEINSKFYPEVDYYFPLIHSEQYPTSELVYANFKGSINLQENNQWVINEIDTENNIIYNRTIIRPYFYWMSVLKMIVNQAGYNLAGDILNNQKLNDLLLISARKYEVADRPESINWYVGMANFTPFDRENILGVFSSNQEILHFGKFRIKGTISQTPILKGPIIIRLNEVVIWQGTLKGTVNFDINFTTQKGISNQLNITYSGDYRYEDSMIEITPIELYDANGEVINHLIDSNLIDFSLALPDCTQGTFIQATMKWFNLDFTVKDNLVTMNFKENLLRQKRNPIDWKQFEVDDKKRTTNLGDSFLIKFKNSEDETYPLIQTFVDQQSTLTENYITNDNTTTIEIDATPLPITSKNAQQSAFIFKDDDSGIFAALRNNSISSNSTADMVAYQTPAITAEYYQTWLRFRISTIQYNWSFETRTRFINPFDIKRERHCYDNYHFIKKIQRDIEDNIESVSVETYILR